ncbi:MAG: nickel pincer cofactor biosynthesis protein LarC [Chloroflexi bacterium]|nr:nickel pincer cofactor biosynthesis protein LarC [Chloroflexota bacterium]
MSEMDEHGHGHPHPEPRRQPHDHPHPRENQAPQVPGHAEPHPHEQQPPADAAPSAPASAGRSILSSWTPRAPSELRTPLLYVDCFSGVAGDMLLGAQLDAGLSLDVLREGLAALDLSGYELSVATKQSFGVSGTKFDVLIDERVQPSRGLGDILAMLERSALPAWVRTKAVAVFWRLARAEARIHNTTPEQIHFHEVGAVDSLVDIVGNLIGLHTLGIREVYASSLPLPGGTVRMEHGLLPAPPPATLEILAGVAAPTRPAPVLGELVTPTGAALLAELATFEQPMMRVRRVGYGYGTKELPWPNCVRIWLGERWTPGPPRLSPPVRAAERTALAHPEEVAPPTSQGNLAASGPSRNLTPPARLSGAESWEGQMSCADPPSPACGGGGRGVGGDSLVADEVTVIEANLDDSTPEQLGYAMELLLAAGALDVSFTALQMKKHRPGVLLAAIARPEQARELAGLILRETSTFGVRMTRAERLIVRRRVETVLTPYGEVRVKLKLLDERATASPEYEDCSALARQHGVPLADVYRAALQAADILGARGDSPA